MKREIKAVIGIESERVKDCEKERSVYNLIYYGEKQIDRNE